LAIKTGLKKNFCRHSNIQKLLNPDIRAISESYIHRLWAEEIRVNLLWLTALGSEGVMSTIIGQGGIARDDQSWETFSSMSTS
jgi:hypothetical protein